MYEKHYIKKKEFIMSTDFYSAVKARRSVYALEKKSTISDERIAEVLKDALRHAPSAYNSQSGRILLLLGAAHDELWDATKALLRPLVPSEAAFASTETKINAFKAAYGTVLFFEDQAVISGFQEKFPLYKDNFSIWSGNSSGMLQYLVWTSLAVEGMGASLQHYNPLIDGWVREKTGASPSWKLTGEMPFGLALAPASEKVFLPLEERFRILR